MTMLRAAPVLGLLSAVGPLAIDMYLPAMPAIATALGAEVSSVQLTLTAFFVAFGLAQLFYGPWADQMGRKVPLYVGIGIFIAASIGCAMAPTIGWLVAFRVLQGAGGAVLMVVPRAIIRDMHTGTQATKLLALVMLVISVSPMLAPLAVEGWQPDLGPRWQALLDKRIRPRQRRCRMLTRALRWQATAPLAIGALRRFPNLAPRVVQATSSWVSTS